MYLYYVANNTNDYGTNIHKCILVLNPSYLTDPSSLITKYTYAILTNSIDDINAPFPNNLVIDNTGPSAIVRVKTVLEQLADLKPLKHEQIKEWYETYVNSGCTVSAGFIVDCAQKDITNWQAQLKLAELLNLTEVSIRDYHNIRHTLTMADYTQMCIEVGVYYGQLYQIKWNLDEQVDSCTTLEELNAIVWPS